MYVNFIQCTIGHSYMYVCTGYVFCNVQKNMGVYLCWFVYFTGLGSFPFSAICYIECHVFFLCR